MHWTHSMYWETIWLQCQYNLCPQYNKRSQLSIRFYSSKNCARTSPFSSPMSHPNPNIQPRFADDLQFLPINRKCTKQILNKYLTYRFQRYIMSEQCTHPNCYCNIEFQCWILLLCASLKHRSRSHTLILALSMSFCTLWLWTFQWYIVILHIDKIAFHISHSANFFFRLCPVLYPTCRHRFLINLSTYLQSTYRYHSCTLVIEYNEPNKCL